MYIDYQHSKAGLGEDCSQPTIGDLFKKSNARYNANDPVQKRKMMSFVHNVIICCGLPFAIVENPHFQQFVDDMDPKFTLPSRYIITQKIIPEIVKDTKKRVSEFISKAKAVSLTLDIWTDRRNHAFMAVTGHTFSKCKPMTFLIAFKSFRGTHSGERIAEQLDRILTENDLGKKVKFVVSDNASNMKKAINVLEEIYEARERELQNISGLSVITEEIQENETNDEEIEGLTEEEAHVIVDDDSVWEDLDTDDAAEIDKVLSKANIQRISCFAHTLQLVVKDGMASIAKSTVLAKCSSLSTLVHHSALFKGEFEKKLGNGRSIPASNATRWNSLFYQLEAVSELPSDKLGDLLRSTDHANLILSSKENVMLQELVDILASFNEATQRAQGEKEVSRISCVLPIVLALRKKLLEQQNLVKHHAAFVHQLLSSLQKRFRGLLAMVKIEDPISATESANSFGNGLYILGAMLDPVYGFIWLDHDHPGDTETKASLREEFMSMFVL